MGFGGTACRQKGSWVQMSLQSKNGSRWICADTKQD